MASRGRTLYVSVKGRPEVQRILDRRCIGSAGPYPNISGMRKKYWGKGALVIRAGAYAYYMGQDSGWWTERTGGVR